MKFLSLSLDWEVSYPSLQLLLKIVIIRGGDESYLIWSVFKKNQAIKMIEAGIVYMISGRLIVQNGKQPPQQTLLTKWEAIETNKSGAHAVYAVVGQKADLLFMVLLPTMKDMNEVETEFNKTILADYTKPYSLIKTYALDDTRIFKTSFLYVQNVKDTLI